MGLEIPSAPELEILIDRPAIHPLKTILEEEENEKSTHQCGPDCILRFPLHHSARRGDFLQLKSFLEMESFCGSYSPLELDCNLRTPLHYAAATANHDKGLECVKVLLTSSQVDVATEDEDAEQSVRRFINMVDKNGDSALHLAARNEAHCIVFELLKNWADFNTKNNDGHTTQLCSIYEFTPAALCVLMKRSICFVCNCNCEKGTDFMDNVMNWQEFDNDVSRTSFSYVCFNFAPVLGYYINEDGTAPLPETYFLFGVNTNTRANGERKNILSNVLVQCFLHFKWQKLKWFCYSAIFFHLMWLCLYIGIAIDVFAINCPYTVIHPAIDNSNDETVLSNSFVAEQQCQISPAARISMIILTVFSSIIALKEMSQFHRLGTLYFAFENFGQIILLTLIFMTIPQILFDSAVTDLSYQLSAFGIFLAWALMLCQISKIPRVDKRIHIGQKIYTLRLPNHGVYIEILTRVFKNVMAFIIIFSPLLLGFGFSFKILLPEQQEFSSPIPNMMKLVVMMTGELEYDQAFNNLDKTTMLIFETASHIFYFVFVIVATMILFNLLIGFTVSDIQGLQKDAVVNQVSNKLEQMYLMESFLLSNKMQFLFQLIHKVTGRSLGLQNAISVVYRKSYDMYNSSVSCFHAQLNLLPDEHRTKIRWLASHNTLSRADFNNKKFYWDSAQQKFAVVLKNPEEGSDCKKFAPVLPKTFPLN